MRKLSHTERRCYPLRVKEAADWDVNPAGRPQRQCSEHLSPAQKAKEPPEPLLGTQQRPGRQGHDGTLGQDQVTWVQD